MRQDDISTLNQQLRERLALLTKSRHQAKRRQAEEPIALDLIVTHNEVNRRHGTGIVLQNIFTDHTGIASIRSRSDYQGEQDFGALSFCLPREGLPRREIFQILLERMSNVPVKRILCVPFYPDSAVLAIAAKEIYGSPLCTYLMDDANIHAHGIGDEIMGELLAKSKLRLANSPEMCREYEGKYRRKFWLLPPIVSAELIKTRSSSLTRRGPTGGRGVLIGNVWGQHWLQRLKQAVQDSKVEIDWYYSGGANSWVNFSERELAEAGIFLRQPLPESVLASVLQGYSFALIPTGTLDLNDDNPAIARLSLPSRLSFITATSNLPIIVIGNSDTAVARSVERLQLGKVCEYTGSSLREAVLSVTDEDNAVAIRRRAAKLASLFSSAGIADWIWQSLDKGEPVDTRFERLIPTNEREFAYFVEKDPPPDVYRDFLAIYRSLELLRNFKFNPDFVLDVGASTGIWSHVVCKLFPNARYVLVEPLASIYRKQNDYLFVNHPTFDFVEAALSDHAGTMTMYVSSNFYGSSLFRAAVINNQEQTIEVEVKTLDQLAEEKRISGRGLLKLDVQYAEHLVLAGAAHFIEQVDAIAIELSLRNLPHEAKTFLQMQNMMNDLGFEYFDDVGEWRSSEGVLEQKDVLFVRRRSVPYQELCAVYENGNPA